MKYKKLHLAYVLVVAVALAFSLALSASAVGELEDVELPEPGEDGYITVTTPEQLARALSETDEPETLSKIRLGNDISTADSKIEKTVFLIDRDLTLDLNGCTWTAKKPVDGAFVLRMMDSKDGDMGNTAHLTVCNGNILVDGGNQGIIYQEAGILTLEDVTLNGGIYTAGTIDKLLNCQISQTGNGYYGAIVVGDGVSNKEGKIGLIQGTTITSGSVGIWLKNGVINSIFEGCAIQGGGSESGCGIRIGDGYDEEGNIYGKAELSEVMYSTVSGTVGIRNSGKLGLLSCATISGGIYNQDSGTIRMVALDDDTYSIDGIYGGTITEGLIIGGRLGELSGCEVTNTADAEPGAINAGKGVLVKAGGQIEKIANCTISAPNAGIEVVGRIGSISECPSISGGIFASYGTINTISNCTIIKELTETEGNYIGALVVGANDQDAEYRPDLTINSIQNCTITGKGTDVNGLSVWNGNVGDVSDCTITAEDGMGILIGGWNPGSIHALANSTITGNGDLGLQVDGKIGLISSCNISGAEIAVWVPQGRVDTISDCRLTSDLPDGIEADGQAALVVGVGPGHYDPERLATIGSVQKCSIEGTIHAVSIFDAKIDVISNCTILAEDGCGIIMSGEHPGSIQSLTNNEISSDKSVGVAVNGAGDSLVAFDGSISEFSLNKVSSNTDVALFNQGTIARLRENIFSGNSDADVQNSGIIETVYPKGRLNGDIFTADSGWTLRNKGTVNNWANLDNGGSSGSGGGSGSSDTTTEKNPDGSTTTTVKHPDGTVIETTKYPDGSQTVVKTAPDKTVTTVIDDKDGSSSETITAADGQVESKVTVSDKRLKEADDDVILLPLPDLTIPETHTSEIRLTVDLPENTAVTVEVPLGSVSMNTVAVLSREDGSEEIILQAIPGEHSLQVPLDGSATLRIIDNSKEFTDIPDGNWYSDPVAFITSRELFVGTGEGKFSPERPMDRAMLVTVLHRMAGEPGGAISGFDDVEPGAWYSDAVNWADETGIVVGDGTSFHPDQALTRESLAVILYRYASADNTPDTTGLSVYTDYEMINPWAVDAMSWAVENGIITGKGNNVLDPQGSASRAEVAAMLMRFIQMDAN